MYIPTTIFGYAARPKRAIDPDVVWTGSVAGIQVAVLRYDLGGFEIEDLPLLDGHFIVYRVSRGPAQEFLAQRGSSVFYTSEDHPAADSAPHELSQGDGKTSPRWHKCDRSWPMNDGKPYRFLGQGYYGTTVFYVFSRDPTASRGFAVFDDQLDRQDAEEHYRLEE